MSQRRLGLPFLGFGVGLRAQHYPTIVRESPAVDWFEAISENYMETGGWPLRVLQIVAERCPLVLHGVSLSIGSCDPLNFDYLQKLKSLAANVRPQWISDHLCWTGVLGVNTHDLLPLPLTEEALEHVVRRVNIVQDFLERPLVLENPSTYAEFASSTMTESGFLRELTGLTGCGLLLDVNNVYVSCTNHGLDPLVYIRDLPVDRIVQFHLAGHTRYQTHLLDTHDRPVVDEVWALYRQAWSHAPEVSTLLEWDSQIPDFGTVHSEVLKAREFCGGGNDSAERLRVPRPLPRPLVGRSRPDQAAFRTSP